MVANKTNANKIKFNQKDRKIAQRIEKNISFKKENVI